MKIQNLLKKGIHELNQKKIEDAILKARMLLEYVLQIPKSYLSLHLEDEISEENEQEFEQLIQRLVQGEPIQYITNQQCFYGLDFYVDSNVLIPQPDTEILVEEVIQFVSKMNQKAKILDMCTGSGAIAIAIANHINCEMTAVDISDKALEIVRKNAVQNKAKIEILQSDMFEKITEKFDVIVSNPPYIETETIKSLPQEVKNEPMIALDGGKDGLDFYRILASKARNHLQNGGILAVEIGFNQKREVMNLFEKFGFFDVYCKRDFANHDRVIIGKWRN